MNGWVHDKNWMKNSGKEWSDFWGVVGFHSNCCSIPIVVTEWQIHHHLLKSSWRWLGGTGLTLSRSSHSSTPRRKTRSVAPYISLGSPPFSGWKAGGFTGVTMKHQRKRSRCWQGSGASWSNITEKTAKRWSCPRPARCYCSNCGQSSPGGSASFRSRGRCSLRQWRIGSKLSPRRGLRPWRKPGPSCAWTERFQPARISFPVGLVVLCLY